MAPCYHSRLYIWLYIWVPHCLRFCGYTIYLCLTCSSLFQTPSPNLLLGLYLNFKPSFTLGWTRYFLLRLYSGCPLSLECCFPPLARQEKTQTYFLMKPFMILQIELIYPSIIIYFNNNNTTWVPMCYIAIVLIRMRFWGFMFLAQGQLVRFVWP